MERQSTRLERAIKTIDSEIFQEGKFEISTADSILPGISSLSSETLVGPAEYQLLKIGEVLDSQREYSETFTCRERITDCIVAFQMIKKSQDMKDKRDKSNLP